MKLLQRKTSTDSSLPNPITGTRVRRKKNLYRNISETLKCIILLQYLHSHYPQLVIRSQKKPIQASTSINILRKERKYMSWISWMFFTSQTSHIS